MFSFVPLVSIPRIQAPACHCHCGTYLCTVDDGVEIHGRPVRRKYRNPAGATLTVRTVRRARNVTTLGEAVEAFSWFEGYTWTLLLCEHCGVHLGWLYQAQDGAAGPKRFLGLIDTRIRQEHHQDEHPCKNAP